MIAMTTMDPRASSSSQQAINSIFTSEEVNKLDEVLSSDSVKQILSDSRVFEHLDATILDHHSGQVAPTASSSSSSSTGLSSVNIQPAAVARGHVATVQEGMDLVDALDSLVNQLTRDQQHPSQPEVDLLGGNMEIGSNTGANVAAVEEPFVDTVFLDHNYACQPVRQLLPRRNDDSMSSTSRDLEPSFTYNTASSSSFSPPSTPQRRSQRQIERIEKSVLEKIKAENQEMLKREKEEMEAAKMPRNPDAVVGGVVRKSIDMEYPPEIPIKREETEDDERGDDGLIIDFGHQEKKKAPRKRVSTPGTGGPRRKKRTDSETSLVKVKVEEEDKDSSDRLLDTSKENNDGKEGAKKVNRSQRQRRKPKRWDDDEVEVDFSGTASELATDQAPSAKKVCVKKETTTEGTKTPSDEENENKEDDEEDMSDDDPDKLWCTCRQPHNNRFMIACDGCSEWFHGTCVGVTKAQGTMFEKKGMKWYCTPCKSARLKALTTPKVAEVKKEPTSPVHTSKPLSDAPVVISTPPLTTVAVVTPSQTEPSTTTPPTGPAPITSTPQIGLSTPKKPTKPKVNDGKEALIKKIKDENKMKIGDVLKQRKLKACGGNVSIAEKKEAHRLKRLIKSSKLDLRKKINKSEKAQPKPPIEPEKEKDKEGNKWEPISKVVPLIKKTEEKKKKFKLAPVDPSFNDLFKAEPIMMPKKIGSTSLTSPTTPTIPGMSLTKRPSLGSDNSQKKTILQVEQNCVTCGKTVPKGAIRGKEVSIYCTEICLEKHVRDSMEIIKQARAQNSNVNGNKGEKPRINLVEKSSGRLISGPSAPSEDRVVEYIKLNPTFEVMKPNLVRRQSSQSSGDQEKKKESQKGPNSQPKGSATKKKEDGNSKQKPTENSAKTESRRDDGGSETVRHNVRKVLKETLQTRCQEADNKTLGEDIRKIAFRIEEELFNYYNKETSHKYKTRYRSLVFNLKDTKNQGLFRKVLTGSISPEKLVRMTADELASSELARWRERENKHALEMIKRDAEAMSQQVIVKKTHKGEEVIETKISIETIDPTKEEDLSKGIETSSLVIPTPTTPSKEKNALSGLDVLRESRCYKDDKRSKEDDTTDKHGQHLFDAHCKICTKQSKHDLSLTHQRSKAASPPRTSNEGKISQPKRVRVEFDEPTNRIIEEAVKLAKSVKSSHLIETNTSESSEDLLPSSTVTSSPEASNQTSSKSNSLPSCWKGFIHMHEVAKFVASAYRISGMLDSRLKDVPDTITVCGRIAPEQVLDYLKKLKSSRTDISVIKFAPTNYEETKGYESFFEYLNKRKRYGVVGPTGKSIKDFYIVPLPREAEPPDVLLPFDGPGLPVNRSNLLLGVLVKNKKHPVKGALKEKSSTETKKITEISNPPRDQPERSYTPPPPGSNAKTDAVIDEEPYDPGLSLTPPHQRDEDSPEQQEKPNADESEEPYDPEENDLNNIPSTSSSSEPRLNIAEVLDQLSKSSNPVEMTSTILGSIAKNASVEEQKLLLEELTKKVEDSKRQLEEQRKAAEAAFSIASRTIDSIGSFDTIPGLDGSYPTDEESKSSAIDDIRIPENLKEILERVKLSTQEQNENEQEKKGLPFEDPIVKNFGQENMEGEYEDEEDELMNDNEGPQVGQDSEKAEEKQLPEPMEIDDDENKRNTIIEVNNTKTRVDPRLRSKRQQPLVSGQQASQSEGKTVSQLRDDELIMKAKLQLSALKKMEKQQQCLEEARNQAMAALSSVSVTSSGPSTSSSSSFTSTITKTPAPTSPSPAIPVTSSSTNNQANQSAPPPAPAKLKIEWKKTCKTVPKA